MAVDNHKHLYLQPGDTVALSSRIIPGNEKAIYRMMNHIARRGADLVYGSMNPPIHVSGHASEEELKLVLNLVRPRYFIPVHGEYRQLSRHAQLAQPLRFAGLEESFVLETGETLEIDHLGARRGDRITVGRVCIDSGSLDDVVEDMIIRDRRHLSEDGFVLPIIAINKHTGKSEGLPEIVSRGFVAGDSAAILQEARNVVGGRWKFEFGRARRLGRDAGEDQDRPETVSEQADTTPAVDYAGNSGSLTHTSALRQSF